MLAEIVETLKTTADNMNAEGETGTADQNEQKRTYPKQI
jgi:hypothetical protein